MAAFGSFISFGLTALSIFKSGIYKGKIYFIFFILNLVESGHLAIKFNKFYGLDTTVRSEGWNWKIPYFERAIIFDVRQ